MGNQFVRKLLVTVILIAGVLSGAAARANNVPVVSEYGLPLVPQFQLPNGQPATKDLLDSISEISTLLNNEVHRMRIIGIPPEVLSQVPSVTAMWGLQAQTYQLQDSTEGWTNDLQSTADRLQRLGLLITQNGQVDPKFYGAYRAFAIALTNAVFQISSLQSSIYKNYLNQNVPMPHDARNLTWQIHVIVAVRLNRLETLKWNIIDADKRLLFDPPAVRHYQIVANNVYPLPQISQGTPYCLATYLANAGVVRQVYSEYGPGGGQQAQTQPTYGPGYGQGGATTLPADNNYQMQAYPFIPNQNNGNWQPYLQNGHRPQDYTVPAGYPNTPPAAMANSPTTQSVNITIAGSGIAGNGNGGGGPATYPQQQPQLQPAQQPTQQQQAPQQSQQPQAQQSADPAVNSGAVASEPAPLGKPQSYKF